MGSYRPCLWRSLSSAHSSYLEQIETFELRTEYVYPVNPHPAVAQDFAIDTEERLRNYFETSQVKRCEETILDESVGRAKLELDLQVSGGGKGYVFQIFLSSGSITPSEEERP